MREGFLDTGFLSDEVQEAAAGIRAENDAWFRLAEDTNVVLMRTMTASMDHPAAHGSNWSKEAVAVRLLMRSSGSFQGVILLAKRGMAVQARILVRSIIEDSFVAAALTTEPDKVIQMLKDGDEASRRFQGQFILAQGLGPSDMDRKKLEEAIDKMDDSTRFLNLKKVAGMSSMLPQYLNYMRLSSDAAHPSATSLQKHVAVRDDRAGWSYRLGPAAQDDVEATLHRAVLSVLPVAVVVNQFMPNPVNKAALEALGTRFHALPTGTTI